MSLIEPGEGGDEGFCILLFVIILKQIIFLLRQFDS